MPGTGYGQTKSEGTRGNMRGTTAIRVLALGVGLVLVAASCGDDDSVTTEATTAAPVTTAGADDGDTTAPATTGGTDTTVAASGDEAGTCGSPDPSFDADHGIGTGQFLADLDCAATDPLEAEGEPIVIGIQNPEGDPAGSFPEYRLAAEAAAEYVNSELGGLGADLAAGTPGRPVELVDCAMAINPADSQRCANELAGQDPFLVLTSLNFFGNHLPIYEQAGITVLTGTPITIGDFTSESAFAVGAGGGCLGTHTSMVEFSVTDLEGRRVAVPWSDTPPGVTCYYDLESKPLDVLNGTVPSDSDRAGSLPDLVHLGVPIQPATPDVTSQASQVLDFDPDVIMYSAQGPDCWNFVDTLGRLGWTPQDIPLVLSGACTDFEAMEAAGPLAEGVYFIGSSGSQLAAPDDIDDERSRIEAVHYQTKAAEYGLAETELRKGFATQGWNVMMAIWGMSSEVVREGGELTPETLSAAFAATDGHHLYNSTPISCATAPPPYVAVCNAISSATQWDGENLVSVRSGFTGTDLLEGTELLPGPY